MISPAELEAAAKAILKGKLVAFPTETVYGLGANALDPAAVAKIYAAKGRPLTSPLIVHVASVVQARELAAEWPAEADRLTHAFWPGPLTLVLKKRAIIPDVATADLDTVALRMPQNEIALALIREAGVPIAAPSANLFTEISPTTAEHVRRSLGDRVDIILDGGPTSVGIESAVVSLIDGRAELLRPGTIPQHALDAIIGPLATQTKSSGSAHRSPGLHPQHYQPRTPLIFATPEDIPGQGVGAWIFHSKPATAAIQIAMSPNPLAYAAQLYATLHDLDARLLDWIAVEPLPDGPAWDGVRDRLQRAARKT